MEKILLEEMSWDEVEAVLKETDTVIIPTGAIESHGKHNPLGEDFLIARHLSRILGERTATPVAPTVPVGDSSFAMAFTGTLTIRPNVFMEYVRDICLSLIHHGFRRLFFFNMHAGNVQPLGTLARELKILGVLVAQVDWWRLAFRLGSDVAETKDVPIGHGSEITTSVMIACRPDLVDMNKAVKHMPKRGFYNKYAGVETYPDYDEITETGAIGDPTLASKGKGETIIERTIKHLSDFISDFKRQPLPPSCEQKV